MQNFTPDGHSLTFWIADILDMVMCLAAETLQSSKDLPPEIRFRWLGRLLVRAGQPGSRPTQVRFVCCPLVIKLSKQLKQAVKL